MKTMPAREAKNSFGLLIDTASTGPDIAADGYNIAVSSCVEQPETSDAGNIKTLNAEIAWIIARQPELRTAIDAIVADLEGNEA